MTGKNKDTALSPGHPLSGDRAHTISPLPVCEMSRDMEGAREYRPPASPASQHSEGHTNSEEFTQSSQHRITKI
ncbi:hypothetical protein M8J75_000016 [Diaphorina citri]|nr:hypothetical protein M8J75_000016 [Diaphorina citri]KAI5728941.1 hypothetical protein M8J77_023526 [Diaphorina citri]